MKPAIDQYNYEEFFLLYVDGELSAADKLAVEQFIQANPGLAVELEMLQQVQLTDESMIFDNKQSLYRNEAAEITLNNYGEQFLLYVDNELDAAAKQQTETFVLQHPSLQEAFTLLKQTRLEPETVLFPSKQLLYRKEEKERRIFYVSWQRVAVAAALAGLVFLVWILLPVQHSDKQIIAKQQKPFAPSTQPSTPKNTDAGLPLVDNNTSSTNKQTSLSNITGSNTVTPTTTTDKNITVELPVNNANTVVANTNDLSNRPVETTRANIITGSHTNVETNMASTQKLPAAHTAIENSDMVKAVNVGDNNTTVTGIQPAVYKELDTDEEDEKKSLLLGSLEINKDKLRGFFRKAGSIFRSKAKVDDDKTDSRPSTSARSLK